MSVLMDVIVALLAAIGVGTVLWAAFGRLFVPQEEPDSRVAAVVRARGDAPGLECTVDSLLWLLSIGAVRMDIVIADDGMSGDARRVAYILMGRSSRVKLCPIEELEKTMRQE